MAQLDFVSDYMEGCAPEILARLAETNDEKTAGYGFDPYTAAAAERIRLAADAPDAEVFLLSGGTQTNRTVIGAMLKPWEGVIAANTGHISTHEAGAIESLGHKVFELPEKDGKLQAADVEWALQKYDLDGNRDHMPAPKLVYVSHPTETGTLYTKAELETLSDIAHRYGARLFLDGARLGYGLGAEDTDVTLADIARTCDAFYIGGTKVGALLAKGRVLGIQFETLFTDDLYVRLGRHACRLAEKVRAALAERGYDVVFGSTTNQTFVKLTNADYERLGSRIGLSFWDKPDPDHTIVRIATSWATREEDVDAMIALL